MPAIRWQHQNIKTRRRPPIRSPPTPPVLLRAVRNNNPRYTLRARCPCHRDSIITMVSPFFSIPLPSPSSRKIALGWYKNSSDVFSRHISNSEFFSTVVEIFEALQYFRKHTRSLCRFSKKKCKRNCTINFSLS